MSRVALEAGPWESTVHQADPPLGDLLSATMLNSPCRAGSPPQCIPLTFIHDLKEIGKRRTS